jgi:hypothetical protein
MASRHGQRKTFLIQETPTNKMTKQFLPVNSMYTPDISYTYPGKLNLDLIKPIRLGVPSLQELFTIIQGVRCGEYLHYVNPLTSALSKASGNCSPTYTQAGSITDRRLETGEFQINMEFCEAEFSAVCTALIDKYIGQGVDAYEIQSNLQSLIFEEIIEAAKVDVLKVMFFGDNSLGAGSSSIYSVIDGVFTKFFDNEAAYCVEPVYNFSAAQKLHDSIMNADQARDILRLLWGNSSVELKQLPMNAKVFWVTGSFWENYYDSIINGSIAATEGAYKDAQNGITELYYRGIKLMPLWFADESLSSESANPFYDEIRHFAIYTAKSNHYMGVERASDLNNLTSCFDCRTNSNLFKGRMRFGYNFVQCDLISWAK